MIVAFSTSSPIASVALIALDGTLLGSCSEESRMRASGVCMNALERLLAETGRSLAHASGFVADLGPGSFTGVRVGVTLAKTLAWANGNKAAGLSSFDLIDPDGVAAVPNKKGEWFLRTPGEKPARAQDLPDAGFSGYGFDRPETSPIYPSAAAFSKLISRLEWHDPEALVPLYIIEPSISVPKRKYTVGGAGG